MEIKDRKPVASSGVWKEGESDERKSEGVRKGGRDLGRDPAARR